MRKNGFSLVEVLIAVMLVGLAIASLVAANISFTKANGFGADLSTAEFLIEQIKERTVLTSYADLHSFDDAVFSPPINAGGQVLNGFDGYSQQIFVENVSDTDFGSVVPDDSSNFLRITAKVLLSSKQISSSSWIRSQY